VDLNTPLGSVCLDIVPSSYSLEHVSLLEASWSEKPEFLRAANQGKIGKKDLIWGAPYKNISKFHEHKY
jgi:hypothetical protein